MKTWKLLALVFDSGAICTLMDASYYRRTKDKKGRKRGRGWRYSVKAERLKLVEYHNGKRYVQNYSWYEWDLLTAGTRKQLTA